LERIHKGAPPMPAQPDYDAQRIRWEREMKMTDEELRRYTQSELERAAALAISTPVTEEPVTGLTAPDYFKQLREMDRRGYGCFSVDHYRLSIPLAKDEPFGLAARHLIAELRGEPPESWGSVDCLNADGAKTYRDTLARLRDDMTRRLGQRPLRGLMASRCSYYHYKPVLILAIRAIKAQEQ
jgi:hypothetical protein